MVTSLRFPYSSYNRSMSAWLGASFPVGKLPMKIRCGFGLSGESRRGLLSLGESICRFLTTTVQDATYFKYYSRVLRTISNQNLQQLQKSFIEHLGLRS